MNQQALGHGIMEIAITSWREFQDYYLTELLDYKSFVFRGQRCSSWMLESTLDRLERRIGTIDRPAHLLNFRFAVQGRRGSNPPPIDCDDDWWALGQHHGLATPLLDWTTSPFVAAFFAFTDEGGTDQTEDRIVYALSSTAVEAKSNEIRTSGTDKPYVSFCRPMSDENPRLLNQSGLFSKLNGSGDLRDWIKSSFEEEYPYHVLDAIRIPNTEREICLKALRRMNISHLSLFPDLQGASSYCNTALSVKKY